MNNSKKKLLTVVLCLAILCVVFTGCATTQTDMQATFETSSGAQDAQTQEDVSPKVLNMAVNAELTTLYPLNMDEQNLSATRLCYESLVGYEDGKAVPWLAKKWYVSEDGLSLTFHLEDGVVFHDGTPFDAEAVKANFEFKRQMPNFKPFKIIGGIQEIEVVDNLTVTFHYDVPYFGYITEFSYREVMALVSPTVLEEGNFQTMKGVVGTGPYIYSEVKDGEYVKFIKNEAYWGDEPVYDEIYVHYIPDASTRLLALRSGEIDMIYGTAMISWDDYEQVTASDNIEGIVSPVDTKTVSFVLNAANPVLAELPVREAIAYAIDKQAICDGLTYGNLNPADAMFPAGNFLSDVAHEVTRTYDVDKAVKLLDDSGWVLDESTGVRSKEGVALSFKLTYHSGEAMNKLLATSVKSQLAEIGIDIQTEGQDMMTWWKEGVAGNYGMIIWNTEENTAPQIYYPKMLASAPHTPSLAAMDGSDTFMETITQTMSVGSQEKAKEMFTFVLNYSNNNVLEIPVYYTKDMIIYNTDKIAGYTFTDTPVMFEIDNLIPAES